MYKIGILFQNRDFEHDVYELIKAFYPGNEIISLYEEDDADYDIRFRVSRDEEGYTISYDNGIEKKTAHGAVTEGQSSGEASDALISCDDAHDTRRKNKDAIKYALYQMLSSATGKTLPWGNLTGIRPVKMAMGMLESGMKNTEIARYMKEQYLVSPEKTALAVTIANRERDILKNIDYENGYSLYVGIPFCPSICLYCSFSSYPLERWRKYVEDYLDALIKEIQAVSQMMKNRKLDTVYIGGGTPTTLSAEELERLLSFLKKTLDFSQVKEFTVEAGRADSITADKLEVLIKYGVTRISVNPQTMKEETLRLIGRQHTVEQVKEAFYLAREKGFTNINMDLILGLPGEDEEDVRRTIEEVKKLNPDSLTVHSLAIKRASRLNQWIEENGIEALHNTDETMKIAENGAREMGMVPYYLYRQKNMSGNFENVGYAREGRFGIYNILIMEEVQTIIALGAGTVTKRVYGNGRIERCDNVKDVGLYIEKIDEMIDRKRKLLAEE